MSQNVNVNLVPGNYPKEFHVSQYDVGRQLVANIVDSTGAYSIPSGATVTLVGTKPSGFGFTLSGSVGSGGVVTFSTTATVTAEYGRIPCEIRITSGDTVLGTANCMLIVEMSPHPEGTTDGDGEVIINQITLLLEQIAQQADRAVAASEAAQASETAAATSESNAAASAATALNAKNDAVAAKTAAQASEAAAAESAAEAEATLGSYAKVGGEYDGMTVGTAKQLLSDSTTTDSEPYIYRQTVGDGDREEIEVVGGTVAWNQLCNSASVTVPSGHKYYMIKGGTASIGASTGTAITGLTSGTDIVHDLTAMFNPTIADAVYAMEQASAGAGVAWFKRLFPKSYYPYNAGELMSVKTSAHATTGFNQWDEEWEVGSINGGNGANLADNTQVRSKNLCRCLPNVTYARRITSGYGLNVFWYDANEGFISYTAGSDMSGVSIVTAPDNAYYFRVATTSGYGNIYKSDICINLSDPSRNGTYKPYIKHTYALDDSLTLMGVPKWENGLRFDGDIYPLSGEVQRQCSIVDFSAQTWTTKYTGSTNKMVLCGAGAPYSPFTIRTENACISNYPYNGSVSGSVQLSDPDNCEVGLYTYYNDSPNPDNTWYLVIPVNATPSGEVVYKLATPTTEAADPYTAIQVCDPNGTEEWIDERTVQIPVGNVTKYHANLKEKLEDLPTIPSAPSANGTYTLKATVSDGAVTYQWVNG